MNKDNKGFSLLEFIIVLGMAAILAGSAVSFTGYIRFANSKSCAEKLYAGIDKLQVTSMAKQNKRLMIVWRKNNEYFYDVFSYDPLTGVSGNAAKTECVNTCTGAVNNGIKFGNSALKMTYKYTANDGTVTTHELADGEYFFIAYALDGSYKTDMNGADEIKIESANGEGMVYTIKLIKETGKHFIK